jgi:D-glycero-D-manno-heptose 1,7-bisphosphate phosphatase
VAEIEPSPSSLHHSTTPPLCNSPLRHSTTPPLFPSPPPAVFLDRDGVLNRTFERDGTSYPPYSLGELEILPGVADALECLRAHGFMLIGVTNQPDVARKRQTRELIDEMNRFLLDRLPLTEIYVCPHDTADHCECRKPKPGMILQAAREHQIDLSASWMVGDRCSDVLAGQSAGCRTILIDSAWSQGHRCTPDARVADLFEAAEVIVRSSAQAG